MKAEITKIELLVIKNAIIKAKDLIENEFTLHGQANGIKSFWCDACGRHSEVFSAINHTQNCKFMRGMKSLKKAAIVVGGKLGEK